jgi:parvulin-like peptidyl-prolyl isomerase
MDLRAHLLAAALLAPLAGPALQDEPAAAHEPDPAELSYLVLPLYLGEEPPPTRALRHVHVVHVDAEIGYEVAAAARKPEEARARAEQARERLEDGEPFGAVAEALSDAKDRLRGGVLGTFPRGMLAPEFDTFLFEADLGDVSEVIETDTGFHVLQRIEQRAAALQILVAGKDDAAWRRALELLARARSGEDFAELAREHSEDVVTAPRGGQLAIFERTASATLLKRAAFDLAVGEVADPLESPFGLHIVKRVPLEEVDPEYADLTWVRGRAILVSFEGAEGAAPGIERSNAEALDLAIELAARIEAGEDMAALAREHDDDIGGRERSGDLGWIHRRTPRMAAVLARLFLIEPGEALEPVFTRAGWLIVRREA